MSTIPKPAPPINARAVAVTARRGLVSCLQTRAAKRRAHRHGVGIPRHAGTRRDIGALARGTARRDGYRRSDLCARESQYRRTNQGVLFLTVPLELVIEVRVRKSARRTACTKTDMVTGTSSGCNRPVPNVRTAR